MPPALVLRVFIPFALGYYLSYLFRTINAVISPDLVADLGIDANGLGLLTGAYLLTFAAFQPPLGIAHVNAPDAPLRVKLIVAIIHFIY